MLMSYHTHLQWINCLLLGAYVHKIYVTDSAQLRVQFALHMESQLPQVRRELLFFSGPYMLITRAKHLAPSYIQASVTTNGIGQFPAVVWNAPLTHLLEEMHGTSKALLSRRYDLVRWQDKPIPTFVTQFDCEDIVGFKNVLDPINRATGNLVDDIANWTICEGSSVDTPHSVRSTLCQSLQGSIVGRPCAARVPVCYSRE